MIHIWHSRTRRNAWLPSSARVFLLSLLCVVTGCIGLRSGLELDAARRAHARGDCSALESSLRTLEKLGALEDEHEAEAVYFRGVCLEQADRLADAAEFYAYVLERHPDSRTAGAASERKAGIPSWVAARIEPAPRNGRTARNTAAMDLGRANPVRRYFTEFGPSEVLRICLLREPRVSSAAVQRATDAMRRALTRYAIELEVPRVDLWDPPSDGAGARIRALRSMPLTPPCDRLLALSALTASEQLQRTLGVLAEDAGVAGEVESDTFSRGYVFVRPMSWFHSPRFDAGELVVHELHHLLRCDHDVVMDDCYRQIVRLKRAAAQNRAAGSDFFPAITLTGEVLQDRATVATVLAATPDDFEPTAAPSAEGSDRPSAQAAARGDVDP